MTQVDLEAAPNRPPLFPFGALLTGVAGGPAFRPVR
jgi:hypothetical protein